MKDILAGACVGWAETLVGYPFVTCKVLLQNNMPWWGHRFTRYYQGVKYPLVSGVAFNMMVFPLHEVLAPHTGHALAGAVCGAAVAPQVFFVDTFMVRRQTNQRIHARMFKGARGLRMTLAREIPAMTAFFGVYHAAREQHNSLVSGAAAGLANWTLTYPLDTLRNRQIAQKCSVKDAWAKKQLWRGYPLAAARSIVVNAVSFTVWEFLGNI